MNSRLLITGGAGYIGSLVGDHGDTLSKYSLLGTKGMIEVKKAFSVNEKEKTIIVLENNKTSKEFYVPSANQFTLMIDNFCEKILNKNYYKKNEMIKYQKILDASIVSSSKNKKINFY